MQTVPLPSHPLLVRPAEAAAYLGVSRAHVYELLAAGRLRAVKYGARRLIPWHEVERFATELLDGDTP